MIDERVTGCRVIRTVLPAEAEAVAALHARARATYYPDGLPTTAPTGPRPGAPLSNGRTVRCSPSWSGGA